MSGENKSTNASNENSNTVNGYSPLPGSRALPPIRIQQFVNQTAVIHGGHVEMGDDYKSCQIDMTTDLDSIRRSVTSSSKPVVAAIDDMITRKLFPCRVRIKSEGKAFYFTNPDN